MATRPPVAGQTPFSDAIVDMDDFLYAYSRLSPVTLDGQENTSKPKQDRRQGVACDALLENILESDGNPVYVMAGNQAYTAKTNSDGWKTTELVAPVSLIDQEFSTALRMMLLELEKRHQQGFQDGLYDPLQQAQEGDTLAGELEKVLKGIRTVAAPPGRQKKPMCYTGSTQLLTG